MVDLITETNADGLRLDVEPQVSGNAGVVWKHVKERCLEKGKKIVLFPEHPANDRGGVYDFEQCGVKTKTELDVDAKNIFLSYNIVSEIKNGFANMSNNGEYKYYTYPMSVHDSVNYYVGGSELKAGYNMLFSPYIPIYYLGEEWNNASKQTLYFYYINYDSKSKNASKAEFYETFKQMVRIRRENPDIFEYFPDNHRETNICAVETSGKLQAYARYAGNRGVLILPNNSEKSATINVTIPFKDMGLEGGKKYTLTNLMTGKVIGSGTREQLEKLTVKIGGDGLMVLAVDKEGGATPTKPTTTPTTPTTTKPTSGSATGTTTQSGGSTSTTESVSGGSTSTSESTQISDVTGSTQESTGTTGSTNVTDADITTTQPSQDVSGGDDNSTGNWWVWVIVAVVAVGGVVVVLLLARRR